jgi:hypothetical protein
MEPTSNAPFFGATAFPSILAVTILGRNCRGNLHKKVVLHVYPDTHSPPPVFPARLLCLTLPLSCLVLSIPAVRIRRGLWILTEMQNSALSVPAATEAAAIVTSEAMMQRGVGHLEFQESNYDTKSHI